jgi:hypothetical protein
MTEASYDLLLREQFAAFCEMVESFAKHVLACAKNKELRYDYATRTSLDEQKERLVLEHGQACSQWNKAVAAGNERRQRRAEKARLEYEARLNQLPPAVSPPKPGCAVYEWADRSMGYDFLDLPLEHPFVHFWITPDVRNPLPWLLTRLGRYQEGLSREESLMCDCVVLAVARDEDPAPRLYGHMPPNPMYKHEPYSGKYFKRDEFCARLWEDLVKDQKRLQDANSKLQNRRRQPHWSGDGRTREEKLALLAKHLMDLDYNSREKRGVWKGLAKATGLPHAWIRKEGPALRNRLRSEGSPPGGWKDAKGNQDATADPSKCQHCGDSLTTAWDCPVCHETIDRECPTCHLENCDSEV